MKILKSILTSIFSYLQKKKRFYSLFYYLYLTGLKGIEQGRNYGTISTSGELNVLKILKSHVKAPVIFDGGANIGHYANECVNLCESNCQVFAFEPCQSPFNELNDRFNNTNCVKCINQALGSFSGKIEMHYDAEKSELASPIKLNYGHYNMEFSKSEICNATTIDDFLMEQGIKNIDLLKLDLEGFEYEALKGCKKSIQNNQIGLIQFEMGRPNVDAKVFFKDFFYLLNPGFDIYRILSYGFTPIPDYAFEYELFLGCNYIAVNKTFNFNIEKYLV